MILTSPFGTLDSNDLVDIAKVAVWTFGSAIVAGLLYWAGSDVFPTEWLWLAPTINTILVGVKNWFKDNKPQI